MNRSLPLLAALSTLGLLSGCGGSSSSSASSGSQSFGPLSLEIVGVTQPVVSTFSAYGSNVTGIAGAQIDQLTLNYQGPNVLSGTKILFVSFRDGNSEIYSMGPDGSNPQRLTNNTATDFAPVYSPDGTKIAFNTSRDGNNEIYVMNADGSNQVRLTNNAASDLNPKWSPDGTKICFSSDRDGNYEIYSMLATGGSQTRLTNNTAVDSYPTWSPDGTKISFSTTRDGNYEIYTMNYDGSNATRLTNNAVGVTDMMSEWSPDGSKLAFSTNRDGNYEVYYMNADGSNQTRVTNNPNYEEQPTWSPDGTRLAFTTQRDANYEVYSTSLSGSDPVNLTKLSNMTDYGAAWSGYLPRTASTLLGPSGLMGTSGAGLLIAQRGDLVTSILTFDSAVTTLAARSATRVVTENAVETNGSNLIFGVTAPSGFGNMKYAKVSDNGVPGTVTSISIPTSANAALVTYNSYTGLLTSVIPYQATRSMDNPLRLGDEVTYSADFSAVLNAEGKNVAPSGASTVTINAKTGELVRYR